MTECVGEPMLVDDGAAMANVCPLQAPDTEGLLHPLVVLNISDHWTRTKAQHPTKTAQKVFGAILGRHEGRHLEIMSSFELKMFDLAGVPTVNQEFLEQREEQYRQTFPEMELIGWYCTGEGAPTAHELLVQRFFISNNYDSPVFLKLDPASSPSCTKLPVTIWENCGAETLGAVAWTLVSEESERIGVDHVNRFSSKVGCEKESEVGKTIRSNNAAVAMLVSRIKLIRTYLVGVSEKTIAPSDEIIREANKLCQMFARLRPEFFNDVALKQEEDVSVSVLLSRMTEICGSMNDLVGRLNTISSDRLNVSGPAKPQMQHPHKKTLFNAMFGAGSSASSNTPDLFHI